MKRIYVDLHLCPNLANEAQTTRVISKASELGYKLIALTWFSRPDFEVEKYLQKIRSGVDIDVVSRLDIKPKTSNELKHCLGRFRRKFEIISVICETKEVARQAAKDRRVDLLDFTSLNFRKRYFDKAEAGLARKGSAFLEIDIKPVLTLEGRKKIRLLSILRRETEIAQEFRIPIVLSSGVSQEFLMRRPRELAVLASLFGLRENLALEGVSRIPLSIVKRNERKLLPQFVAPGIRIVQERKDS